MNNRVNLSQSATYADAKLDRIVHQTAKVK